MKFSLRQLQVFQTIDEAGSVSDAAKILHLSQSAASMALAQLESLIGHKLFHRYGRHLELTAWGQWLRPHAQQLLQQYRTIEQGMEGMDLIAGDLRVGASQTPAVHAVPRLFSELDRSFPQLRLQLMVDNSEGVINSLLNYRCDLGLIEGYCDDERVAKQVWQEDELVVAASVHHPFSQQERVSISQLSVAQWILRERGAGTREIFDISIHEHLNQIKVHREFDQVGVILEMVANGPYLTCLSYRSIQPWVQARKIRILTVPELEMKRHFSFIWRRKDSESTLRQAVIQTATNLK